jgi:hypothetical protein
LTRFVARGTLFFATLLFDANDVVSVINIGCQGDKKLLFQIGCQGDEKNCCLKLVVKVMKKQLFKIGCQGDEKTVV